MEKLATENLFLFEFLVDDVQLDEKCDCETPPGDLCVSFQFLDNDALDVCEPDTKKKKADNTKSGKSCLFSLTADQIVKALEVFDVTVSVFKKMQPGWLPDKILVGEALISVANLFTELVENVESRCDQGPAAKTLKDMFNLTDSNGGPAGRVGVYIRMSCFGKLIVTQFQMNLDDKSVLFKDKGGQSLYRYKKAKKNDPNRRESILSPCDATASTPSNAPPNSQVRLNASNVNQAMPVDSQTYPRNVNCPAQSCYEDMYASNPYMGGEQQGMGGGGGMYGYQQPPPQSCPLYGPPQMQQQQQPQPPPSQIQYGNYPACCMPEANGQMVSPCVECGSTLPPQYQDNAACPPCVETGAPGGVDPPGHYQEIGASMGGNALTIRVHKDKNKIEQVDGEGSCCQMTSSKAAPTTSQAQCFALQPGPAQGDKNMPFSFKVSGHPTGAGGGGGGAAPGNITINPPVCSKPDGTKYTEISDPDKEVFVLRIGKKSEGVQKKANLELELCTPRGPEIKPIPKKETRDSQYDPSDCKDADGGKGKKGKGKGKGKGKDKKGKKGGKGKGKKKK